MNLPRQLASWSPLASYPVPFKKSDYAGQKTPVDVTHGGLLAQTLCCFSPLVSFNLKVIMFFAKKTKQNKTKQD